MKKNIIKPLPDTIQKMNFNDYVRLATLKTESVNTQVKKGKEKPK